MFSCQPLKSFIDDYSGLPDRQGGNFNQLRQKKEIGGRTKSGKTEFVRRTQLGGGAQDRERAAADVGRTEPMRGGD